MSLAGPARGRKPEHSAKLMQVLAKLLVEIFCPHLTTTFVRQEKVNPLRYDVTLTAFVKGTGLSVWPSPRHSGFCFVKFAKLCAAWELYLAQPGALPFPPHVPREAN